MLALRLLHALAGTAACAWGAAAHGGTLYLLTLLLPAYQGEGRVVGGCSTRDARGREVGVGGAQSGTACAPQEPLCWQACSFCVAPSTAAAVDSGELP